MKIQKRHSIKTNILESHKPSFRPFNWSIFEALTSSAHDLSFNHDEHGLGKGLSNPTPPVNKNRHI